MSATSILVRGIKSRLRAQNMSYRELARQLAISEPTVKRDLSRGQFSLKRLDKICAVLGVDVGDLLLPAESAQLTELSEAQEEALVAQPRLLLVTYLVVNDWRFADIIETFRLSDSDLVAILLSMDRLRIVDFRPPNRVRKLTARNFSWRKTGPVQSFFIRRVLPEFFGATFDHAGDEFKFMGGTLAAESRLRMQSSMRRVAAEFEQLARQDARLPLKSRDSCTLILAMSGWEFSEFSNLRRSPRRRTGRADLRA
jgi:transcriptional regulator with XRE-family HTH domain